MVKALDGYTTGIMVKAGSEYGLDHIRVYAMMRRADEPHPMNCGLTEYDAPLYLDGLCLDGSVSEYNGRYRDPDACFKMAYSVNGRKARAMAKTLAKVEAAIAKAQAREPGDILMAFAKAIGATWSVRLKREGAPYSCYRDTDWTFGTIADGREQYRRLIREAEAAMLASGKVRHPEPV